MTTTYGMSDQARAFVLERLDQEHIADLAEQAKMALFVQGITIELCYQPGDATWYSLILGPVRGLAGAVGGGSAGQEPTSFIGNSRNREGKGHYTYVVAYAQRETVAWFKANDDMEWVAGKLIDLPGSTLAIAELLKAVFS